MHPSVSSATVLCCELCDVKMAKHGCLYELYLSPFCNSEHSIARASAMCSVGILVQKNVQDHFRENLIVQVNIRPS
jgi:hypothetical protein